MRSLAVLTAAFASLCLPAWAAPPVPGWHGTLPMPTIACDTRAQIEAIVAAGNARPDGGGQAQFDAFAAMQGIHGEPACMAGSTTGPVSVVDVIVIGPFAINATLTLNALAVRIVIGNSRFWVLYLEPLGGGPEPMSAPDPRLDEQEDV